MKKTLFSALASLAFGSVTAQSGFFTKTCYRGAFAPAPAAMWTDNWTEWDPQNKNYPVPTMTITGDITSNTIWNSGSVVLLSAQCFITGNSMLTIQPGVVVLGDKSVQGSCLVATKGSQIIANGTAQNPIVFTSNQAPGGRYRGDWGGIILLGKASNNLSGGTGNIEGFPVSANTQHGVTGGSDDNDNSGSLQYVRIEFGGYQYQPNQEINGLTMGSVGRSTTINNVQISFCNDDAFEWFGGTVNAKRLVSFRNLDDDFDTDNGYSGMVQFCLAVRDPDIADNPSVSTSEIFESDNNASGDASTPFTSAIFSNVTAIGPLRGSVSNIVASGHRRGLRIRRNSHLKVLNSIFTDNATRGIFIDGSACETNANNGGLVFNNNILAGYGQRATETGTFGVIAPNANGWLMTRGNDTLKSTTGLLANPYNYTLADYRPATGSPALNGALFTHSVYSGVTNSTLPVVLATIPASFCVGNDANNPGPVIVSAFSTVSPEYCALNWVVPVGVVISNSVALAPSFTITGVGTFSIQLIVTNAEGTSTINNSVTTYTCLDVGISEHFNQKVSPIYPNPAENYVVIQKIGDGLSELSILVQDITGKTVDVTVEKLVGEGASLRINTVLLNSGLYFVTIVSAQSKETVKLLVQH